MSEKTCVKIIGAAVRLTEDAECGVKAGEQMTSLEGFGKACIFLFFKLFL